MSESTAGSTTEESSISTRRLVAISLAVAVAITIIGTTTVALIFADANDRSCNDSDCNGGYALIMVAGLFVSLVVGAIVGGITGAVLAMRKGRPGRRHRAVVIAMVSASVPLGLFILALV